MKNRIHYSKESRRDMDDIWDYIVSELQNPTAAEQVVNSIMDTIDGLEAFAEIGTPLSSVLHIDTEYRFLVSGKYLIFYRAQGTDVYIDRVIYGRRDYLRILFDDTGTIGQE